MNTEEQWLSLDEYIELITTYLSFKQKLPFERLSSKLIRTLVSNYQTTPTCYPTIDGYWKPGNPQDILKFDSRLSPINGWVLFSMKTSSTIKNGIKLLQDSVKASKHYANNILKTDEFTWIGVTNISLSPKQEAELIDFGKSQGVKNVGIFRTHDLDNCFIKTIDDAKDIAFNLGIQVPQYKYKLEQLSPATAAGAMLYELNHIWNNIYNDYHLRYSFIKINNYFERRMKKVQCFYLGEQWIKKEEKIKKHFNKSMSLDVGDDVVKFYLAGERFLNEAEDYEKISKSSEIGKFKGLTGEDKNNGKYIVVRDLTVVYCFYRYILRFFQDKKTLKFNMLDKRAPFSNIFNDFCKTEFRKEHTRLFFKLNRDYSKDIKFVRLMPEMHPIELKYRLER